MHLKILLRFKSHLFTGDARYKRRIWSLAYSISAARAARGFPGICLGLPEVMEHEGDPWLPVCRMKALFLKLDKVPVTITVSYL